MPAQGMPIQGESPPPMQLRQRDEIDAQTEECGMSEGYEAAIAAQDIPGQAHHRPDRHDGQDQLQYCLLS